MTNITIIGAAGRMGRRLIALTAEDPELQLVGAVDAFADKLRDVDAGLHAGVSELGVTFTTSLDAVLPKTHVVIDFSAPTQTVNYVRSAFAAGAAYVLGTTGMSQDTRDELAILARGGRLVAASNFSIGVNTLFVLVEQAARILGESYDVEIIEMHHNQKKDAPSGTAETLGELVAGMLDLDYVTDTRHGRHGLVGARTKREIGMHSLRGGDVVGDHTVIFATGGERVELSHKASSRDTFAAGALRAAKFVVGAEPGMYDMRDVLGLRTGK